MLNNLKTIIESRTAIRCKNLLQTEILSTYLDNLGYKWCDGRSYTEFNFFNSYKEDTCYYPFDGTFCDLRYFISNKFHVIDFEDIDKRFKSGTFITNYQIKEILCRD